MAISRCRGTRFDLARIPVLVQKQPGRFRGHTFCRSKRNIHWKQRSLCIIAPSRHSPPKLQALSLHHQSKLPPIGYGCYRTDRSRGCRWTEVGHIAIPSGPCEISAIIDWQHVPVSLLRATNLRSERRWKVRLKEFSAIVKPNQRRQRLKHERTSYEPFSNLKWLLSDPPDTD